MHSTGFTAEFRAMLHALTQGFAIVAPDMKVLFANAAAQEIFRAANGVTLADGFLTVLSVAHDQALKAAVAKAIAQESRRPVAFSVARTGQLPVSVIVGGVMGSKRKRRLAGIYLSDPAIRPEPDPKLLSDLFAFTRAEAEVARRLMRGDDTASISRELRIKGHTVRNHLKHMFAKTNAAKQCELVYLLMLSPAALRLGTDGSPAIPAGAPPSERAG